MDVVLANASVFALPGSQRADAIAYDGTLDLGLWRPPGPDRDLLELYGDTLSAVLSKERALLSSGKLALGAGVRLHPGKLRCDYLIWLGVKPPHGKDEPAPAPALSVIEQAVGAALELASKHDTSRVAFGVFGSGPGQAEASERLAAVVRGAHEFRARLLKKGASTPIEEVLVCSPSSADIAKARRLTSRLTKTVAIEPQARPVERSSTRSSGGGARGASSPGRSVATPASRKGRSRRLDPEDVALARTRAQPYDRNRTYYEGEWFMHPTFGAGQVQLVLAGERMVTALFEDGEERKLIHARA